MKKLILFSLTLLIGASASAQKKVKSPVEGRIYSITVTEPGKKKSSPFTDEFSFIVNTKFKSTFMMNAGFPQMDYEVETDSTLNPIGYKFSIEAKNESQERFSWEGRISGETTEGTLIIRKKGKIDHSYNFSGTWKNKKKPKPAPKTPVVPEAVDTVKHE